MSKNLKAEYFVYMKEDLRIDVVEPWEGDYIQNWLNNNPNGWLIFKTLTGKVLVPVREIESIVVPHPDGPVES